MVKEWKAVNGLGYVRRRGVEVIRPDDFSAYSDARRKAGRPVTVIGEIDLRAPLEDADDAGDIHDAAYAGGSHYEICPVSDNPAVGFIAVSANEFVRCQSHLLFLLPCLVVSGWLAAMLVLILLMAGVIPVKGHGQDSGTPDSMDSPVMSIPWMDEPVAEGDIAFPGFTDMEAGAGTELVLGNPEGNTVTFTYLFYEGERQLYVSGELAPGETEKFLPAIVFGPGKHHATIQVVTADVETGQACTGAVQEIEVTVAE